MAIETLWAVYFSPTQTTKTVVSHVANTIAQALDVPCKTLDFTTPQPRQQTYAFSPSDLVIMGTPVYAGRVPNVLLPFLTQQLQGNGALAVPISLYGNRDFDDALIELRDIMEFNGFATIGAGAFIGQHSFSKVLAKGRPDAQDLQLASQLAQGILAKLPTYNRDTHQPIPVTGHAPIRPYYTPKDRQSQPVDIRKVQPITTDACTQCGLCASLCPMGSIDPKNAKVMTGICIKCCACERYCPTNAKYFNDEKYLYHRSELEKGCATPKQPTLFI